MTIKFECHSTYEHWFKLLQIKPICVKVTWVFLCSIPHVALSFIPENCENLNQEQIQFELLSFLIIALENSL